MERPNCYKCIHRRDVAGDAHSKCVHPTNKQTHADPMAELMAIFASVQRVAPVDTSNIIGVTGNEHGIKNGWFNYPFNFDPVWLETCDGFEAKT